MDRDDPYNEIINSMNDSTWVIDFNNNFLDVNDTAVSMLGFSREELLKMGPADIDIFLSEKKISNLIEAMPQEKKQVFETIHKTKDGKQIPVEISSSLITYRGQKAVLSVARDISLRKNSQKELAARLEEKELLIKEVHHRTKNNLSIVESFLELQAKYKPDSTAIPILQEAAGQMKSMRILYDKLLFSDDNKTIPVRNYFEELIESIIKIFPDNTRIKVNRNIEIQYLEVKLAFLIGVIINEIVTNIMKHSLSNTKEGLLEIEFVHENNEIKLEISDNGCGFPENFDMYNSKGFGLMIIRALCKQLGAKLNMRNNNGTVTTLIFPV